MQIKNCVKCGKMFQWMSGDVICDACKKKEEDDFKKVKQYIEDNPSANMNTISKDCEVKVAKLQQWVREERLVFAKGGAVELFCENCGAPIQTGRFCDKCKNEMASGLTSAFAKPTPLQPERKKPISGHAAMQFLKK